MTSITAHQTKLDLELVPKENRLDIVKCNGRIPHGLKPKEETFQVVLDALALTPCYPAFVITADVPEVYMHQFWNSVYKHHDFYGFKLDKKKRFKLTLDMHQPWRTFAALINRSLSGKTIALDKLCISRAHILWGMYFQKNRHRTSQVARKFKKVSPSKKDSVPLAADEEPIQKGKRVKRSAKKSLTTSTTALTEEAQMKEVRKKSLRDFHKSHPSGSGSFADKPPSVEKITPTGNDDDDSNDEEGSERENDSEEHKSDSEQDTDGSELDSESDQQDDDDEVKDDDEDDDNDEVPRIHTSTLLAVSVSVIPEASPVYMNIPQSSQTFNSLPLQSTPSPLPTTETTNIPLSISDFASVFRFNDRVTVLEKVAAELKNDPLYTQVTALVDNHLDTRMGETREEFMNFLSASLTDTITEQMIEESLNQVNLEKVSSQPQSTYEAAITLTEFELKKILIDKINASELYLTAPEHRECYDDLVKSYNLDKDFFSFYDVYLLKRSRDDKDKDKGPSTRSGRGLKKQKTSKDAEPTTSLKTKDSSSRSSKRTKSQPKSFGKSVHADEPEFEVGDTTPQGQEGKQGNDNVKPIIEFTSRCNWFTKPSRPQEPTDPDWNEDKTPQKGPTQNWLMTLGAFTSTGKSLREFNELMSTPIDVSSYILNGLKIKNLTREILLGPAFKLLKVTCLNYAELEYDFEECYKALSEKLDWENPEGDDYPFDLSKPLPLITCGNRESVPVEFFINNDHKYLQGGVSTMTYTMSTTKTKATQYDLPGIEDMVPNICSPIKVAYDKYALWGISHWRDQRKTFYAYARGIQSRGDVYSTKRIMVVTQVLVMRKHGYRYLEEIMARRANNKLYKFNEGFIYVDDYQRSRLIRSDELYKFSDDTLTRLLSSLEDITKNLDMNYLPKRRWSKLEKKRAPCMIKDINKLLKERRMMRSLEKFVSSRLYGTDLRLLQRTI
uniref:Uncharacterized protein n=1 Tax=Tanacetum cinerariifolium TaxID=118510 RepID=A0A6L2KP11_TANCI|nr:hypothetical protein [Tanacetum cinerariifolium]